MKIFITFFLLIYIVFSYSVFGLEKGKWSFVKTDEYCYIVSLAVESDLPPDKYDRQDILKTEVFI